jgi:pantothenate kinase
MFVASYSFSVQCEDGLRTFSSHSPVEIFIEITLKKQFWISNLKGENHNIYLDHITKEIGTHKD